MFYSSVGLKNNIAISSPNTGRLEPLSSRFSDCDATGNSLRRLNVLIKLYEKCCVILVCSSDNLDNTCLPIVEFAQLRGR
jgi:hypothetical protein